MSSLAQMATLATNPNSTEYIFPQSEADPLHGTQPNKIKYDGQFTQALLY